MAESGQERTEQASQKRLEDAASRGQVPYSRELTAAALMLITLAALRLQGGNLVSGLEHGFVSAFSFEMLDEVTATGIVPLLRSVHGGTLAVLVPMLLLILGVVAVSGYSQVGFSISFERIESHWSKLNPLNGLGRIFSKRSLVTLGLAILKLLAVVAVAWPALRTLALRAGSTATSDAATLAIILVEGVFSIGFRVGGLILVLAMIDFVYQRFQHSRDLMMTKDEVKEERRSNEGDPRVKGKIRQIQKAASRARLGQDVKKATVVVRNPTHFAVALRYEQGKDPAPRVLAKGRNLLALRIIAIAEKEGVPVRTDPPLARQIYKTVRVGRTIPEELFQAVARILAWVYRKRGRSVKPGRSLRPDPNPVEIR